MPPPLSPAHSISLENSSTFSIKLTNHLPFVNFQVSPPQFSASRKINSHSSLFQEHFICTFSSVVVWLFATPWTAAHQDSLFFTVSRSLLKLMSIKSVMLPNHLILCYPLLLMPSIFPSTRVFSSESAHHIRWPECWSFSFSINPSNEYSELISFRMDWLDLLAVQGTLKSLL